MANKRNKRAGGRKNKINPIYRPVTRVKNPRVNFNGNNLDMIYYSDSPATATNYGSNYYRVDCSTGNTVSSPYSAITALYDTYVYEYVRLDWVPFVAPGVADGGSQITIGYIDNPEKMINWQNLATDVLKYTAVRQMRGSHNFPAWEQHTFIVPLTRRRKRFDVNNSTVLTTDEFDRSVQGYVAIAYNSLSAIVSKLGTWKITALVNLHGLDAGLTT